VDLSDLASVRRFADQFAGEVSSLERLVFSAGVILPKREETSQGIEKTLAINYLSAYLLAQRLKGLLVRGHKPRVLFVSGGGAIVLKSRLDFADFQTKQGYLAPKAAMRAVHAKTVLAQILAEDWKELGISVNAFHPGVVRSKLGRNLPWPINKLADVAALAMSPDSKMGIAAALADEFEGLSGYHFEGKKRERLSFDADYCKRLREASEGLVGR
jgi:NAD(P)-dependent dehydrogenase (short-subunit alcohol dehydrogenase family)